MPTSPALPVAVDRLIQAINNQDTAAFLAQFADEGYVDDWGRTFRGADAIRGWSDSELIGVRGTLAVTAVRERDGETVVTADVGGGGFNGPSHFSFRVEGDLIAAMTIRE